jgi:SAM-dependent methyltransferase
VLDDEKHYWVGEDEVEKLLRRGGDWLPVHPAKEIITRRYLKHRRDLARQTTEQLTAAAGLESTEDAAPLPASPGREEALEKKISLSSQRLSTLAEAVRDSGAQSIVDLGCGDGKLLRELMKQPQLTRIVGMDVAWRSLDYARERLHLDELSPTFRDRIQLIHGSLVYRRVQARTRLQVGESPTEVKRLRPRSLGGTVAGNQDGGALRQHTLKRRMRKAPGCNNQ